MTISISPARLRLVAAIAALIVFHLASLGVMVWSESDIVSKVAFVLFWGLLNLIWIFLLRRPTPAAVLSFMLIASLILLSWTKFLVLSMTVTFVDVMLVDLDATNFLLNSFTDLRSTLILIGVSGMLAAALFWWLDPIRVRYRTSLSGLVALFALLAVLSFAVPLDREDEFRFHNFVSKFARSAAVAVVDLMTRQMIEADVRTVERLSAESVTECPVAATLPNIIMILDESNFDLSVIPGIKVWPDYQRYFKSFDGKERHFIVEGAGGPTWYTEYNVLSGLSVHSYGRFAGSVTRIATGRVERGLPRALRQCGYRTFSIYPYVGAFLGARGYQTTAGIEHFLDSENLGTSERQPDVFYYDFAARTITWERGRAPLFLFVYTAANHFPWTYRFRPDLMGDWRNLGNRPDVDEYLRRQAMSAQDYAQFLAHLRRDFPDEPFLIVRFGDHQPLFARYFVDPTLDDAELAQRIKRLDPRYLTTYYAIDTINFAPANLSSALDTLDAPYLPLVVLEAAGVPLDPSFAEQKKIMQRCRGLFYACADGAEARRFNRLLIDAGLIKGF